MTDVLQELASIMPKQREQFHQSFMRTLSVCQLQAMYRYQLGIRRPPAAYLHVGSAVDASVGADLGNKIATGELLKRDDAIGIAEQTFDAKEESDPFELDPEEKKEGVSKDQAKGEAKDKAVALAGLHYDKVAPVIKPSHVARKFSINMDSWLKHRAKELHKAGDLEQDVGAAKILHAEARAMNSAARIGIDLAGEIDVQEKYRTAADPSMRVVHVPEGMEMPEGYWAELISVRDTKTSGKSPSETSAEDSNQLVTYSFATLVLDKTIPDSVTLDYLVRTPKRHDLKYVPRSTTVNRDDINVLLFRFSRAVHAWHAACKTGAFLPANPDDWHCSERFCGYWGMCPAAKRPKSSPVQNLVQIGERP